MPAKRRSPRLSGQFLAAHQRLLVAMADDDPNRLRDDAVWVQVAQEGAYKGHSSGEFQLEEAAFEQIIVNFRSHPSYQRGDDGYGVADVVAWDYHHESEKTGGSLAVVGALAQGWVLDLELRKGEEGIGQLWALSRFLEPALTYVREGRYHWSSVALWPNAQHPVTGEDIGWNLSSVALTNDPSGAPDLHQAPWTYATPRAGFA